MEQIGKFFKTLVNYLKEFIIFVGDNWLAITLIIIALMMIYLLFNIAYIPRLIKKAASVIDAQMSAENESYEEFKSEWFRSTCTTERGAGPATADSRSEPETALIDLFEEGGD